MALNLTRRSIEFLVAGALPPDSPNVLWMDTSVPDAPVLKMFWNGAWVPCHTEATREIYMLAQAIKALVDENNSYVEIITSALEGVAKQGDNPDATNTAIYNLLQEDVGEEEIDEFINSLDNGE